MILPKVFRRLLLTRRGEELRPRQGPPIDWQLDPVVLERLQKGERGGDLHPSRGGFQVVEATVGGLKPPIAIEVVDPAVASALAAEIQGFTRPTPRPLDAGSPAPRDGPVRSPPPVASSRAAGG